MRKHINSFLTYLQDEKQYAPNTIVSYTRDLTQFAAWLADEEGFSPKSRTKGRGWEKVTYLMLRRFLGYLARQNYDRSSVVRKLSVLKVFFRWLQREGFLTSNPAQQVAPPKFQNSTPEILTISEVEHLLSLPDGETPFGRRDKALLEVLYATGMRVAEAAALSLADVDLRTSEVRIKSESGRSGATRVAPLGRYARQALQEYLERARPRLVVRCKQAGATPSDAVWINGRGTRLTTHAMYMLVLEYARQSGIEKKVTPQSLRHAFVAHMLQGGADLQAVKELLGYNSLVSLEVYTRLKEG